MGCDENSDSREFQESKDSRELESYQRVARPGLSTFFVQLRDHFFHQGPNGSHLCLVTELLGPSLPRILEELSDKDRWLAPNIVLKSARQLLEALEALHRAGFAHGGMGNPQGVTIIYNVNLAWRFSLSFHALTVTDLNPNNIVFTCHRMKNNENRMWKELVAPICHKWFSEMENHQVHRFRWNTWNPSHGMIGLTQHLKISR